MSDDEERLRRPREVVARAEPTGTMADTICLDVSCSDGHESKIPLAELAANGTVKCRYCGKPIDVSTPEWQKKIDDATNVYVTVKPLNRL